MIVVGPNLQEIGIGNPQQGRPTKEFLLDHLGDVLRKSLSQTPWGIRWIFRMASQARNHFAMVSRWRMYSSGVEETSHAWFFVWYWDWVLSSLSIVLENGTSVNAESKGSDV